MAEDAGILERAMKSVVEAYDGAKNWANEVRSVGSRADDEAERRFPGQERDESVKNAYRHALGTGRLSQLLGADSENPAVSAAGQAAGQGAGYLWEIMSAGKSLYDNGNAGNLRDTRHDLNANAIGAETAGQTRGFGELADALSARAKGAVREEPPLMFEPPRKHFTYTK